MNPASWLPLAAKAEFTQPRVHLLADPCSIFLIHNKPHSNVVRPPESEPDGGPARRDQVAGAARGAVGRAAAHGEGAHPAEAALPLQLQHRPRIPQEQEGA